MKIQFSKSYHGQTKPIEPFHRTLGEFQRMMLTYVGLNVENKPARMNRGEKMHSRLYEQFGKNTVPTISEVYQRLNEWFLAYIQRPQQDGQYKGRTPEEVFMESIEKVQNMPDFQSRLIDAEELTYLMMAEENRSIRRNGIERFGAYYWNEALYGRDHAVRVRYDNCDDSYILVYDENDQFICRADKVGMENPHAKLLGTPEEQQSLKKKLNNFGKLRHETIEKAKPIIGTIYSETADYLQRSEEVTLSQEEPLVNKQLQARNQELKLLQETDDELLSQLAGPEELEEEEDEIFLYESDKELAEYKAKQA